MLYLRGGRGDESGGDTGRTHGGAASLRGCHVIAGLPRTNGGPTSVVVGLTKYLARLGVTVEVITVEHERLDGRKEEEQSGTDDGVDIVRCRPTVRSRFGYSLELGEIMRERAKRADLVHVHGLWSYPTNAACAAARRYRVPYVISPHGALSSWALRRRGWRKALFLKIREAHNIRNAAAVHVFTQEEKLDQTVERIMRRRLLVIGNGVDPELLEPKPPRGIFRGRHGLGDRPLIAFVGRIHPVKRLELLVEAFHKLVGVRPDTVLAIAGPEVLPYSRSIRRLVGKLRLDSKVIFTGMLEGAEKCGLLRDADVFALPSYQEGQSVAMIEALYYGLPVITTKSCNAWEAVASGAGIAVDADPGAIGAALDELLGDTYRRERMGRTAVALAEREHTWLSVARRMLTAYRSIIGESQEARQAMSPGAWQSLSYER